MGDMVSLSRALLCAGLTLLWRVCLKRHLPKSRTWVCKAELSTSGCGAEGEKSLACTYTVLVFEGKIDTSENLEAGLVVAHADTVTGFFFPSVDICRALFSVDRTWLFKFLFSYGITLCSPGWRHTDSPVSVSQVLGFQVCGLPQLTGTTTPSVHSRF